MKGKMIWKREKSFFLFISDWWSVATSSQWGLVRRYKKTNHQQNSLVLGNYNIILNWVICLFTGAVHASSQLGCLSFSLFCHESWCGDCFWPNETVADVPESWAWWRVDFQSGYRVLKKVFWTLSYLQGVFLLVCPKIWLKCQIT